MEDLILDVSGVQMYCGIIRKLMEKLSEEKASL